MMRCSLDRACLIGMACGLCVSLAASHAGASVTLINPGPLSGGQVGTVGVSANGSKVLLTDYSITGDSLGIVNSGVWDGSTTLIPKSVRNNKARAISANGAFVAGYMQGNFETSSRAYRWSSGTGAQDLGMLPGDTYSQAKALTADGSVVVGTSVGSAFYNLRAFRWTGAGMTPLGSVAGFTGSRGEGVSRDGSVIAGTLDNNGPGGDGKTGLFRWTEAGGMQQVATFAPGSSMTLSGLSADGSTMVGYTSPSGSAKSFLWSQATGLVTISAPAGYSYLRAGCVSADGSTIYGQMANSSFSDIRAFRWTAATGVVDLKTYLNSLGANTTDWSPQGITGVSDDGSTLVGYGGSPGEFSGGIVIRGVPTPSAAGVLGIAGLLGARRRRG